LSDYLDIEDDLINLNVSNSIVLILEDKQDKNDLAYVVIAAVEVGY
jgi:hypothetical protein